MKDTALPVVYWKSDIEGYEPRMFRGAIRTFNELKPPELAFEVLGKAFTWTKCRCDALFSVLMDLEYNIFIKGHPKDPVLTRERIAFEAKNITDYKLHFDVFACLKPPCLPEGFLLD